MTDRIIQLVSKLLMLSGLVASSLLVSVSVAQNSQVGENLSNNLPTTAATAHTTSSPARSSPSHAAELQPHAIEHYQILWGVDSFLVRSVSAGQMIRFSYRVVDSQKAAAVNDKKEVPYLIDQAAGVKLVVPTMDKIGQLRQSSAPEAGKSYWMLFSNKGGFVKSGDRVSVEIGKFHVDGLLVQ